MRYDWYNDDIIEETKPQYKHQNVVDKYWNIYVKSQVLKMMKSNKNN